jgi:hypothetical protein
VIPPTRVYSVRINASTSELTIFHLPPGLRIDHLVSQRAQAKIRALGNKEEILRWWLVDNAAVYGPETPQNSEQTTLAATVRTHDQEMLL